MIRGRATGQPGNNGEKSFRSHRRKRRSLATATKDSSPPNSRNSKDRNCLGSAPPPASRSSAIRNPPPPADPGANFTTPFTFLKVTSTGESLATCEAVPEPSTYALLAGSVAISGGSPQSCHARVSDRFSRPSRPGVVALPPVRRDRRAAAPRDWRRTSPPTPAMTGPQ